MSDPISMNRMGRVFLLITVLAALLMAAPLTQPALAVGGDIQELDFIAVAPFSYEHYCPGEDPIQPPPFRGAYNDRTIGRYDDVVESLETGDFLCGDMVTYLILIRVAEAPVDPVQTLELDFSFLASATGQQGVAHVEVCRVAVNYGNPLSIYPDTVENGGGDDCVGGGVGAFDYDCGIDDDGGSQVINASSWFEGTPFTKGAILRLNYQVTDLEAGEQVVVRMDTRFDCLAGTRPTGNLQADLVSAKIVWPAEDAVSGGAQTIPFKITEICFADIEKHTNGQDADDPDGPDVPCIAVGETVTWTYIVTNNSNVRVDYVVNDSVLGPGIFTGALGIGETISLPLDGIAEEGLYENVAEVIFTTPDGHQCADTDPSHYRGAACAIDIEKYINGEDADDPPGICIPAGSSITWKYVVSYNGSETASVEVTDDGSPVWSGPMDPGTVKEIEVPGIAEVGPQANEALATAEFQCGESVLSCEDSDPANYFGSTCDVSISKLTNGEDGPCVPAGSEIKWTYEVTNNSNVAVDYEVTDDPLGLICAGTLDPGQSVTCEATGTAKVGDYSNSATVVATNDECGVRCEATDDSSYFGAVADVSIEKLTNGEDGPCIPVGADVKWTYEVTNMSNVPVDYVVEDSVLGEICTGTLDVGESTTCEATGTAQEGLYENEAKVTVENVECGVSDSATDDSSYFGATCSMEIKKLTNGEDDICVAAGSDLIWTYEVTNNGNTDVEITVTDSMDAGPETVVVSGVVLPAGGSDVYSLGGTALEGSHSNVAKVVATPECGDPCEATDDSSYFGAVADVSIEKLTNGEDGPCIPVGADVKWTYEVTNMSNVPVDYVVEDSVLGEICTGTLDVGESTTCEATGTAQEGLYENEAKVTVENLDCGVSDSATDDSSYFGATCSIDINKKTNGQEDCPYVAVGSELIWTYEVTNNGNTEVKITVTDSMDAGPEVEVISGVVLPAGASDTYQMTGTALEGSHNNVAKVVAVPECGDPCEATDKGCYFGVVCDIAIVKLTNGEDGPCVPAGSEVKWTYEVTNNGNEAVDYVVDDVPLGQICAGRLDPNQSVTCEATGTAKEGLYENEATVTATGVESGVVCSKTDDSSYFGAVADVSIEKLTNGEDGPCIPVGADVKWTYKVTNMSNVPVDYVVEDSVLGEICTGTLDIGESTTCEATGTAQEGLYENEAKVTVENVECGVSDSATDDSSYFGATCSIDINKKTNGQEDCPYVAAGSELTWTYDVTNNGNTEVMLTVTDSMDGGAETVVVSGVVLPAGGSDVYTLTGTALEGSHNNVAKVVAVPECGDPCEATDKGCYFGVVCDIAIVKLTNGEDGPCIPAGSDVKWTYEVTNNGNEAVDYVVDDDPLGQICAGRLDPDQSVTCEATGIAQEGLYENEAKVTATGVESGVVCSNADTSSYFGAVADVSIEKLTNGEDGPCIPVDAEVKWTYEVTNLSNVPVDYVVEDSVLGEICTGTLDVGESTTCEATGTAQEGLYENEAKVTVENLDCGVSDSATDDSSYFGATCSMDINKLTNGVDNLCISAGDSIEWTYEVTNNGNTDVEITVTDSMDAGPPVVIVSGVVLPAGGSQTFQSSGVAQEGPHSDIAKVVGVPECGEPCEATDDSSYFGVVCDIGLEKLTNGEDAPCLLVGSEVKWTYKVANNCNLPIDFVLDDDQLGLVCEGHLEPGESTTCEATGTVQEGTYKNVAKVTGTLDCAGIVLDPVVVTCKNEDPSEYFGATCSVDIEKSTNGEDADEAPGPEIPVGDPVTWKYVVTNNSNVPVDYKVTDSVLGDICDGSLDPGQSVECTAEGVAGIGPYENVAKVDATNGCGGECSDSDPSHYTGVSLFQGCTPGYWKQEQHFDSWKPTGYSPDDLVGDVFEAAHKLPTTESKKPEKPVELAKDSLVDALDYPGGPGILGAARTLLRAAVAALLNAAHDDLKYEIADPQDVIDAVNEALASLDRGVMLALAGKLDDYNNAGCFDDMEEEMQEETSSPAPAPEGPPMRTVLGQNVPNPPNPDTWIPFRLENDANVKIEIYDVTGRLVRRLDLGYRPAGSYWDRAKAAYWDGRNESGEPIASGVYFYRMSAGDFSAIKRMVILK